MPLIEPSFTIPRNVPLIGGEWGPFVNPSLRKDEQKQLFTLFIVSLLLILIFGTWAYYSNKNEFENNESQLQPQTEEIPDEYNVSYFLGLDKLIDGKALMVGMGAGIVFGLIDNGGLWFGMDALDPVFEGSNVPWVYGYGGKRAYSGLTGSDNGEDSVYYGVKFKDGVLTRGEKIGIRTPHEICKKIENDYTRIRSKLKNSNASKYEKFKQRQSITTNEKAFADPDSPLFLGANMTKKNFFDELAHYKINESNYSNRIDNYRDYLNNKNLPKNIKHAEELGILTKTQKTHKLKLKRQLRELEKLKLKNLGFPTQKYKDTLKDLKIKIRRLRVWPGNNKKLAQAWMGGWTPGKLTQAGIGNTFSDCIGAFLATFVGVLIVNMSKISKTSLLSEVFGIVVGCLIGIMIPRMISPKS
jgi:hypothetical protein